MIHPLDHHQCDMMTMRSYHIPKSYILDYSELMNLNPETGVVEHKPIHYHSMVYNEEKEMLFVKTCVPQQTFIEGWLKATVPNFRELNPPKLK